MFTTPLNLKKFARKFVETTGLHFLLPARQSRRVGLQAPLQRSLLLKLSSARQPRRVGLQRVMLS